jgi:hypothetical protein
MGSIKRKHKSLQTKLDSLGDIDLGSLLEDSMTDPLNALDEAVELLDGLFGGDGDSDNAHDAYMGGTSSYTRGARGAGGSVHISSGASARHNASMARHDAMMKRHGERLERHAARMERHREKIENIGKATRNPRHLSIGDGNLNIIVGDNSEHKHTLKLRDTNTDTVITVTFRDEDNYAVESNTGTIPDTDEIKRHIRNHLKYPPPEMPENETFTEHELSPRVETTLAKFQNPLFWSRTWRGGKKEPIEITVDSKVTVSGHNMFGRKYEVTIDGTVIYVPNLENYLLHNHEFHNLDSFVEMCTDEEKVILSKIIDGLIALKIAETHHTELKELL